MNTPDIKSVFVEVALVYCCCWLNFISKKKRHKCEHYSQASFCDTDNQRVNDGSKMKNSSSALQQATRPAGHKTQDQATQTTCEIPSPVKSNRDSADFIKNEVLRIPFFSPLFSPSLEVATIIRNVRLPESEPGVYFCLEICLGWKV